MRWAYASATQAGLGKAAAQDACAVKEDGEDLLALAVSDGAGSAPLSHLGARFVAQEFCRTAGTEEELASLVPRIAERLRTVAEEGDRPIGAFAATLVGAVVGPDATTFVQVGDGIAVYRQGEQYEVAISPEPSEYVNSTYFVTDEDVVHHVQTRTILGRVDEVALLTDGLQGLVLRPEGGEPHDRFFETVFRNIRAECGHDETASAWLSNMLASDLVTQRTDDDTTIVAACRRGEEC
jgi:serine/threonine protein phosphatase PrpC